MHVEPLELIGPRVNRVMWFPPALRPMATVATRGVAAAPPTRQAVTKPVQAALFGPVG